MLAQPPPRQKEGPLALVLVPTQELAAQFVAAAAPFWDAVGVRYCSVSGGQSLSQSFAAIRRATPHVLVGTAGRVGDIIVSKALPMRRVTCTVLDEADRMMDAGTAPLVSAILGQCRPDRLSVVMSATFSPPQARAVKQLLTDPLVFDIGLSAAGRGARVLGGAAVDHQVEVVATVADRHISMLRVLGDVVNRPVPEGLGDEAAARAIVFTATQRECEEVYAALIGAGYRDLVTCLHGGLGAVDRSCVLHDFASGPRRVLVATSLMARGIDVPTVAAVVNFTPPSHAEDYVHRAGRTGRAGRGGGVVLTTLLRGDSVSRAAAADIVGILQRAGRPVPPDVEALAAEHLAANGALVVAGAARKGFGAGCRGVGFGPEADARRAKRVRNELDRLGYADNAAEDGDDGAGAVVVSGAGAAAGRAGAPRKVARGAAADAAGEEAQRLAAAVMAANRVTSEVAGAAAGGAAAGEGTDVIGEIEIRGFSERARRALTTRSKLASLSDAAGARVDVRGVYVPRGPAPPQGHLRLRIVAQSADALAAVRAEVMRTVQDLEADAQDGGGDMYRSLPSRMRL